MPRVRALGGIGGDGDVVARRGRGFAERRRRVGFASRTRNIRARASTLGVGLGEAKNPCERGGAEEDPGHGAEVTVFAQSAVTRGG